MIFRRTPGLFFRSIASTLLASLLVVLTLAANPHWHQIAHAEHGECAEHEHEDDGEHHHHDEHSCVVDLFATGSVDHATPLAITPAPPQHHDVASVTATTQFVASIFVRGSILEHAPPASA